MPSSIHPWQQHEITLQAKQNHLSPYTSVEVWADFTHENGTTLRRPAFWDGENIWKLRFASPGLTGRWTWHSDANVNDTGLRGQSGEFAVQEAAEQPNRFYRHGFWRMSESRRNLIHADGTPALLVADTPWAIPFRATPEQVRVYAQDRQRKGFNAALLMTVQPDMGATGPRGRTQDESFDVAFEDLAQGHLNELNPAYFQVLDELLGILVKHEIVPVLQPAFHGHGWKGLGTVGKVVPAGEYARYCRYLVARYGAQPAMYLILGDGRGHEPGIAEGGAEVEAWDCYGQPTGLHYAPSAENRAHQDADWLDFQWCQTGHLGDHIPERVADMRRNVPVKAVANGEPTYENHGANPHPTRRAGGRATKPGATCVQAARWAWSTARAACGNGGCMGRNRGSGRQLKLRAWAGARRWSLKAPVTSG